MKIGITELIVVFIVALVVLGPDKLPIYAKKLGEALAQFKKYSEAATKDIKESIVEPLEEAQRPLKEAMEPLSDLDQTVRNNVKEVENSLKGIGKPKKAAEKSAAGDLTAQKTMDSKEVETAEAVKQGTQEVETAEAVKQGTQEVETAEAVKQEALEMEAAETVEQRTVEAKQTFE